jgi:hypothetical protein
MEVIIKKIKEGFRMNLWAIKMIRIFLNNKMKNLKVNQIKKIVEDLRIHPICKEDLRNRLRF